MEKICNECGEDFIPEHNESTCQQCQLETAEEQKHSYFPRPEDEAILIDIM